MLHFLASRTKSHFCLHHHNSLFLRNQKRNRSTISAKIIYFVIIIATFFFKQKFWCNCIFSNVFIYLVKFSPARIFENLQIIQNGNFLSEIVFFEFLTKNRSNFFSIQIFLDENVFNVLTCSRNTISMRTTNFLFFENTMLSANLIICVQKISHSFVIKNRCFLCIKIKKNL